ncbi:MAG: alkaline phosphatase PhoX [Actinomycetota bacterium]
MRPKMLVPTLALAIGLSGPAGAETAVKDYVVPVGTAYEVDALFSVADKVPETSDPFEEYQMIGIPDGLGAYPTDDGAVLFMNHELNQSVQSQPLVGGPLNRGAFVSRYVLDDDGDPVTGERAYDTVYREDTLIGPAAETGNSTPGFSRFCSGSLAWKDHGFDRPIFLTGEETDGADTFDGKGGQTVAVFDNEAHALSGFGHFAKENTLVQPKPGKLTVAFPMEDGPSTPDSQLYVYVGKKDTSPGATVLERNGLVGGTLYVFRSTTPGMHSEATFQSGTITGEWIEIPGAADMTTGQLEAAADAAGAFAFVRPEDGAFDTTRSNEFYFDTTGGNAGAGNELGRMYHLRLGSGNPSKTPADLRIVYNADEVIDDGGDIAISPDNIDVSGDYLVINEDGTTQSRLVMGSKGRDGSIWRFPIIGGTWFNRVDVAARERIAELDPPGRDGTAVGPGVWETSGIIDTSGIFGDGSWITDVQAHGPTVAPAANTVEDGQLLILRPSD